MLVNSMSMMQYGGSKDGISLDELHELLGNLDGFSNIGCQVRSSVKLPSKLQNFCIDTLIL